MPDSINLNTSEPNDTLRSSSLAGTDRQSAEPRALLLGLVALAAGIAALTVNMLLVSLVFLMRGSYATQGLAMVSIVLPFTLGLAAAGLLLLGLRILGRLCRINEQVNRLSDRVTILAEQSTAPSVSSAADASAPPPLEPAKVYRLLGDIQEILLLPDAQRQRRFRERMEGEIAHRLELIDRYIVSCDFHHAREELAALAARFGEDERCEAARTKLDQAVREVQSDDIARTRSRLQNLMGQRRWDEAEAVARELAEKYPDVNEPLGFIEHICRERQLDRQRLFAEVDQLANQRQWRDAAEAAQRFIETYPNGSDSDTVRSKLPTLEDNAEIQVRQQMENQIKEYLRDQRYWDALAVARKLIADYPFSPQANALRTQMARLEELARNQRP